MNPWIVIEPGDLTTLAVLNESGLGEYRVETSLESDRTHDASNIYARPEHCTYFFARSEQEAQALATLCAKRQPGRKWMWLELRGIAVCKPGDVEITQVTEKGALPA